MPGPSTTGSDRKRRATLAIVTRAAGRLVERTGKGCAPAPAGRAAAEEARRVLRERGGRQRAGVGAGAGRRHPAVIRTADSHLCPVADRVLASGHRHSPSTGVHE
nr:hypothetical protein KitaXyl93_09270 [Kitasatospora sp. Xyl93]